MYLIVNVKTRAVMNPYNAGFYLADRAKADCFFTDEGQARNFAEFCARKWPEGEFGLATVGPRVKSATPPVEWTS